MNSATAEEMKSEEGPRDGCMLGTVSESGGSVQKEKWNPKEYNSLGVLVNEIEMKGLIRHTCHTRKYIDAITRG